MTYSVDNYPAPLNCEWQSKRYVRAAMREGKPVVLESDDVNGPWSIRAESCGPACLVQQAKTMPDNIQTRIREYLRGENDEDHRKLLRDAVDAIDTLRPMSNQSSSPPSRPESEGSPVPHCRHAIP